MQIGISHQTPSPSGAPQREVYFMGLIDVLTQYDTRKKAAHAAKAVKHGVRRQKAVWSTSFFSTQQCFSCEFYLRWCCLICLAVTVFLSLCFAGRSRNLNGSPGTVCKTFQRVHRPDVCLVHQPCPIIIVIYIGMTDS